MEDVTYSYGDQPVLKGVSLTLRRGEIVALTGPKRDRQDDAREDRGGAARRPRTEPWSAVDARATCRRTRGGTWSRIAPRTRSRSRSAATLAGRVRRSARSGSPGSNGVIRATCRAVSASALRLPPSSSPTPQILILDEPTRGVDPPRKAELADLLRRDATAPSHARRHARSRLRGRGRGPRGGAQASREPALSRLAAFVAGGAAVAAAAWVAVAPEHSGLPLLIAAMGLVVIGAAWLETGLRRLEGDRARRDPRGGRRRRPCALRRRPGRAARDGDRGRSGRGARSESGLRHRRARRACVELLPRPGAVDSVADARLGGMRAGRSCACTSAPGTASRSPRSASCSASRSAR